MPLAELLAQSDIVSLHAPFTPQTAKMIDAASIATMKDGAILINTARGELVDEKALYDALVERQASRRGARRVRSGAAAADNPLLKLDQVVTTPHAGGGVFDNVENVARHSLGNIVRSCAASRSRADVVIPVRHRNESAGHVA